MRLHTEARLLLSVGKKRRLPVNPATALHFFVEIDNMSQFPSLGRPRSVGSAQVPPRVAVTPSPPLSDSDPGSNVFDPHRTPPPPAAPIFGNDIPEEKRSQVGSPQLLPAQKQPSVAAAQWTTHVRRRAPSQRPLTGRPPAPPLHRGVKPPPPARWLGGAAQPQMPGLRTVTRPRQRAANTQQAANVPTAPQNPLEVIQTTLLKIQSYLDTLAAVSRQQPAQPSQPHHPAPTLGIPRANPIPSASPATLADLISLPQLSRKR